MRDDDQDAEEDDGRRRDARPASDCREVGKQERGKKNGSTKAQVANRSGDARGGRAARAPARHTSKGGLKKGIWLAERARHGWKAKNKCAWGEQGTTPYPRGESDAQVRWQFDAGAVRTAAVVWQKDPLSARRKKECGTKKKKKRERKTSVATGDGKGLRKNDGGRGTGKPKPRRADRRSSIKGGQEERKKGVFRSDDEREGAAEGARERASARKKKGQVKKREKQSTKAKRRGKS